MEINQSTIDYLRLIITAKDYGNIIRNNPTILDELNNLLPTNKDITSVDWSKYDCAKTLKENDFDILRTIGVFGGFDTAMGRSTAYRLIYTIVSTYVVDIEFSSYYKDQFLFYVDALPSHIGGKEVDNFIDTIYINLPPELPKGKKTKYFKETLQKHFLCKNEKKPYWPQEPDWPSDDNGTPLVFVSQKRKGDLYEFTFEDRSTGCVRIVEQFL